MNFRPKANEEPEINLIPFIDVLLVILIFLFQVNSQKTNLHSNNLSILLSMHHRKL